MMKNNALKTFVTVLAAAATVVACGGGDDNERGTGALSVSTGAVNAVGPSGVACQQTPYQAVEFDVSGGVGPYTLGVGFPPPPVPTGGNDWGMTLSTYNPNMGERVKVFVFGCFAPGQVTVLDQLGARTAFAVTAN
jgi:hypothetical protein